VTDATPDLRTPAEIAADLALKNADLELKAIQADKDRAEVRKSLAEAVKAEVEAEGYQLDIISKRDARRAIEAGDRFHHVYYFADMVHQKSVEDAISTLTLWSRMEPGCDIEVILNSPGGSVFAGVAFYDFLISLRAQGHRLTVTAQGIAASMAGILLQAGDVRRMGAESWVLIHEGSMNLGGSFGEVTDTVEWMKKWQDRAVTILAKRSKLTKTSIKAKWKRKDWWLSSDECLAAGLVDEVV
jgi:ATP-dependent Clp endopeptidase proteolytic subunit ClpP